MAKEKSENNPETNSVVDLDHFISADDVSAVWASGLQVYLRSRGGNVARTLPEWRKALSEFQKLG